jgi:16S rRNA (adenine1518-N6/adenine1519-N6)-dimethyltransferase
MRPTPFQRAPGPARRRFGQNFLTDPGAVRRIVSALDPRPGEAVLEIGPGRGALTGALVDAAGLIAAVEVDRDLARLLRSRFPPDRLALLEGDVLRLSLESVGAALGRASGTPLAIVGNLPYNISKPVAMRLVESRALVARAVLMFQREVAERLTASPGERSYGPLTVLTGAAFSITALFDLQPGAFRPRPRVVSTVTRWIPRRAPEALAPGEAVRLRACLAAAFARRRRTLLNNLKTALPGGEEQACELLAACELDSGLRAEQLPADALRRLARVWPMAEERDPGADFVD